MADKLMRITVIAVFFLAAWGLTFRTQHTAAGEQVLPDFGEQIVKIESKVSKLLEDQQNANREISGKLDQVLSNQERILKELSIVKIRATK